MTEHDRVQEALAARALHAVDRADLAVNDAVVSKHLPACASCRRAMDGFELMVGELALLAPPREPPRLLWARLRREIRTKPAPRRFSAAVAAVAVAGLVGMAAWNAHLTSRVGRAEHQQAGAAELIDAVSQRGSKVVPLSSVAGTSDRIAAAYVPGRGHLYVFGSMHLLRSDRVYQVWLVRGESYASLGTFVPSPDGLVLLQLSAKPTGEDAILVTEEDLAGAERPSEEHVGDADL
jgi:hypothetical protein